MPEVVTPDKPKRGRPKTNKGIVENSLNTQLSNSEHSLAPKGITLQQIVELVVEKQNTVEDAAKILGCSVRNIYKRLEPYQDSLKSHGFYKTNRQEIFDVIEQEVAFSFTPNDIKSASFRDRSVLFGILRDKANDNKGITNNYFQTVVMQAHDKTRQDKTQDVVIEGTCNASETGTL